MCQDFQTYVPASTGRKWAARLVDQDGGGRCEAAAHKLGALVAVRVLSTVAGEAASDLEDHAAGGRLEAARPLVEQLEAMARELVPLTDGLSLETLRNLAEAGGDHNRTDGP